jgi:hypothetical protein
MIAIASPTASRSVKIMTMSLRNGFPPSAGAVSNHATARRAASANSSITRPVVSGDPLTPTLISRQQ